jgi:hypothetical protein
MKRFGTKTTLGTHVVQWRVNLSYPKRYAGQGPHVSYTWPVGVAGNMVTPFPVTPLPLVPTRLALRTPEPSDSLFLKRHAAGRTSRSATCIRPHHTARCSPSLPQPAQPDANHTHTLTLCCMAQRVRAVSHTASTSFSKTDLRQNSSFSLTPKTKQKTAGTTPLIPAPVDQATHSSRENPCCIVI